MLSYMALKMLPDGALPVLKSRVEHYGRIAVFFGSLFVSGASQGTGIRIQINNVHNVLVSAIIHIFPFSCFADIVLRSKAGLLNTETVAEMPGS